jgi:hypothetical protein
MLQQQQQMLMHQETSPQDDSQEQQQEEEGDLGRQYSEAGASPNPYGGWVFKAPVLASVRFRVVGAAQLGCCRHRLLTHSMQKKPMVLGLES